MTDHDDLDQAPHQSLHQSPTDSPPASPPSAALLAPNNRLFVAARRADLRWPQALRQLYPPAVLLAGLAIPIVGQLVFGVPIFLIARAFMDDPASLLMMEGNSTQMAVGLVIGFLPIYLLVWGWLRFFERRSFKTIGLDGGGALVKYLRGFLIGLLMFGAGVALMALLGWLDVRAVDWRPAVWRGLLIVLTGWIVQGAAEEVLARGFMLPIIGARWHPVAGVVISSSIFGLLHLFNPNLNWLAMVNLIFFGLFAALYALWEEGLWGVFAIHSVWNWAQGNLFGLEVSGQAPGGALLIDLAENGPDLFTGGAFGPEGGLIVTLVLAVSSLAVWLVAARRPKAIV